MNTQTESVRRQGKPLPLRHPYFQTYRDQQAEAARVERMALIRRDDAFRARIASARILEAVA